MVYLQNKETDAEVINPKLDSPSVFYSQESGEVTLFDKYKSYIIFVCIRDTTIFEQLEYDFTCTSLTSINDKGTIAQWNAITKGALWHYGVPSTTVVTCTDGTVALD